MKQKINIIWFENDLRVHDHEGLYNASQKEEPFFGIYILPKNILEISEYGIPKMSQHRLQILHESLVDLQSNLLKLNITLFVFIDDHINVFSKLSDIYEIKTCYHQKTYGKEETERYQDVRSKYELISFKSYDSKSLYHLEDLPFSIEEIPNQFTLFKQRIEKDVRIRQQFETSKFNRNQLEETIEDDFKSFSNLYTINPQAILKGGENEAIKRINHYFFETKKLKFYKQTRNQMLRFDDSSKLSPYLALGTLSPRYIYDALKTFEKEHGKNISTYWLYFELLWRDYFHFLHVKFSDKIFYKNGLWNKDYQVEKSSLYIDAWKSGKTGYPLVDANMIELMTTGWMSNRGRQNVASFFTKYIKQDWRIGAAWFEYLLIDYDVSSNYGNWLYQAGLGVDPRQSRIFDVTWQGTKYDESTLYLRKWLPQFQKLPKELRYHVENISPVEELKYDFVLGKDYPYPVVKKPFIPVIKKRV